MSKGSNTTTTSQSPTALPAYQGAINQLQQVGATPYTPYGGELVSPINQQQYTGIGGINQNAYSAIPYLQSAEGTLQSAANPLTAGQIQNYQSPYTQDVINATMANFANSNAMQQQQVLGNAAAQGALGGDRTAVAQSVLAGQQQQAEAPTIAGLENTGYGQAVNLAMQQYQQNPEQAAYGIANTGQAIENAGLTGANAQVGAGTLEQQTQQAQDTAAYQQAMMAQFMPESMLSWELPLLTGVGSQEGGTSTTTGPPPNTGAQMAGLGIAGIGALGQAGGSAGIAGLAPLFAALASGGSVSGRVPTIPETSATLRAQQRQLISGHRHAQMFPHGTDELQLPRGMTRTEADGGVVHHNPQHISPDQVRQLSSQGRENEMLGLGPYSKDEILHRLRGGERPVAVVERDPNGTEVRASLGTHNTADRIHAAMNSGKSPGHSISIEHPHHVLAARMRGGRVQGLQTGGVPGSFGFTPGALPGNPWLVAPQMQRGPGAPPPPKIPGQTVLTPQQMVQNATGLAGSMKSAVGDTTPNNPSFGGGNAITDSWGGSAAAPLPGLDASDYSNLPAPVGDAAGGRVMGLKRGGTPVRAGLGMASFMPRRHFDSGGSATDDVMVDDRPSSGWSAALSPVSPVAAAYGAQNPYASAPPADQEATAGIGTAAVPQGGASTDTASPLAPPLQTAPSLAPQAGIGQAQPDPMDVYQHTVKNMETGGMQNPYSAAVPSVDPKTGKTRYALGAYGVMDFNVPQWTKEVFGEAMTPQQFLADSHAQDAVFRAKFGEYADKHGPEGAARAWLAGEGNMNNPNATDKFGTDPLSYGRKFANSLVGAGMNTPGGPGAQLPPTSAVTQGLGLSTAPDSVNAPPASVAAMRERAAGTGPLGLSQDFYQSLMAAGLGMMASRSPFAGVAIGEGGMQGLQTYTGLKNREQDVDLKVSQLDQQAKAERDRIGQEAKQLEETTRHNKETENIQQQLRQFQETKPETMFDQTSGTVRAYQRDPTGVWRWLDTGQPMVGPGVPTSSNQQPGGAAQPSGAPAQQQGGNGVVPAAFTSADGFRVENAKAVASGQPYNYSNGAPYIEGGMDVPEPTPIAGKSPSSLKADAEYYLQTGKFPAGVAVRAGNSPVALAQNAYANAVKNYAGSLAASRNITPEQTADMWRSAPGMLRFIMGADGRATVSLGTAMRHLDLLQQLGTAWDAGDNQTINRVRAALSREFGSDAATNLTTASQIIGPEIIKAIGVAGGGGEGERQAAAAWANPISSPQQLSGAIKVTQGLLAGQLEGKKNQAAAAGVDEQRFKNLIGDRPYEILTNMRKTAPGGGGAAPAAALPAGVPTGSVHGTSRTQGPGWQTPGGRFIPDKS